jgi:adenylate cyclase
VTGSPSDRLAALARFADALAATEGFEAVIDAALDGIVTFFGHEHALLLFLEPDGDRLVTFASRGYEAGGIGSEVRVGEGVIGAVAATRRPMRIGNLQRMIAYLRSAVRSGSPFVPGTDIRLPGLPQARSQLAAPMIASGHLLGVIAAESAVAARYDADDEHVLAIATQLVASALDLDRRDAVADAEEGAPATTSAAAPPAAPAVRVRHYGVDGSTFLDDEYVIKGVAGRLLWKLAQEHEATGRTAYTNREARLDPALEMPSFKDNFESRLVLLKRRLEERAAPIQIQRPARGRFTVEVHAPLELELVSSS